MSNKRDNSIKDCFKVRKGLCVTGDSTLSGDLIVSGINILDTLDTLDGARSLSVFTTVSANSATWGSGGGGTGGAGIFITNITSDGITNKTTDSTQVQVGTSIPVLSAVVDDPNLHLTVEWEGTSDEWTGYPTISGHDVTKQDTTATGSSSRRYRATKTIDFTDYKGNTIDIPVVFKGTTSIIQVEIAGEGPVAQSIVCDQVYPDGQDHFKAGDELTLTITFDSTDVQSVTLNTGNNLATQTETFTSFESSTIINGKRVIVIKTDLHSGAFSTNVLKDLDVKVTAANSLGTTGAEYTEPAIVPGMLGPVITDITFDADPYPGDQTELKTGDSINVHFTFDTNKVNRVQFNNSENTTGNSQKSINTTNKTGSVSVSISTSLKSDTTTFARSVKARAQSTSSGYTYGDYKTSVDKINVNNQYPEFVTGSIIYPSGQSGIRQGQTASVHLEARFVGSDPEYLYAHPTSQLKVPPGIGDTSHANDVYVLPKRTEYNSGDYNISTPNISLNVKRKENGAEATGTHVVNIANVPPIISVTSNNGQRMRSGGRDGTTAPGYPVRVNSDQELASSPAIVIPHGTIGSWSSNSDKTQYANTLTVHDDNEKGTHQYTGLVATGITGLTTSTINTGEHYTFGGFISRQVDISAPGQPDAYINVLWSDYSKLSLSWSSGVQLPIRAAAGTTAQTTGGWAIVSQTAADTGTIPVEVRILDYSATMSITTPSTITIEETI
jgi:hypothetical protein